MLQIKPQKIVDGDTFHATILDSEVEITVRVAWIQAPERGYSYFKESKEKLQSLLIDAEFVEIKFIKRDCYNRVVAEVYANSLNISLNISEEMVKSGYAIEFEKYSNNTILQELQKNCQTKKLGIFADSNALKYSLTFQKKLT